MKRNVSFASCTKHFAFDIPQESGIVKVFQLNPGKTRAGELIEVAITAHNHKEYK